MNLLMKLDLYQIDAFTDELFRGNPACVVPLTEWLPDELPLLIARENAVAETAFFVPKGDSFHLRWFTPDIEMDLCGHATLATTHALHTILGDSRKHFVFTTASGELTVTVSSPLHAEFSGPKAPTCRLAPHHQRRAEHPTEARAESPGLRAGVRNRAENTGY